MANELYTLAYFSRNTIEDLGGDPKIELGRILDSARRNNTRTEVTGALIFSDNCFAQVLEGPKQAVQDVFDNIELDPRHTDVTVLHFDPLDQRRFADWSMAFAHVPHEAAAMLDITATLKTPDAAANYPEGRDIVAILQDLIARHAQAAGDDLDWPSFDDPS